MRITLVIPTMSKISRVLAPSESNHNVINAEEAFVTTTPYCMMPVTQINGLKIGDGHPGPIFRTLLAAWGEHVGLDIGQQIERQATVRRARAEPEPVA